MSIITDRKMKEKTTGAIMILSLYKSSATDRNNYVEWIVAMHNDLG